MGTSFPNAEAGLGNADQKGPPHASLLDEVEEGGPQRKANLATTWQLDQGEWSPGWACPEQTPPGALSTEPRNPGPLSGPPQAQEGQGRQGQERARGEDGPRLLVAKQKIEK